MATHRFVIDGKEYDVDVGTRLGSVVQVTVNGKGYEVELPQSAGPAPAAAAAAAPAPRPVAAPVAAPAPPRPAPAAGGEGAVTAPIPGVVLHVVVSVGDHVTAGTKVAVLEAMKMENEIFAPTDGVVTTVHVKPQQEVRQGDPLVTITPN